MAILFFMLFAMITEEWSQFRGPESNGHVQYKDMPEKWSDQSPVAWKVSIPGLGWSSPVVVNGRVYLTTAVAQGEGLSLRTLCLDSQTGKTIWEREVRQVSNAPKIQDRKSVV